VLTPELEALLGPEPGAPESAGIPATASADALGELLDLSNRSITDLAGRGLVVRIKRGQFDVRASLRAYIAHLREGAAGRGADSASLTAERTRAVRAQAELAELKGAKLRGDLLPAAEVEQEWAGILRDIRATILALPGRLQGRLGHLAAADVAVIDEEIRDTLRELCGDES
jgi:phage terminase Nu1 subunit (DNA packaging protein)